MLTEQQKQKILHRIQKLTAMDDMFMRPLFQDNPELAAFFFQTFEENPNLKLTRYETQKDYRRFDNGRSVGMDLYGIDSSGGQHNLEIQRKIEGASLQRARYHASLMDIATLQVKEDFSEMRDVFVIMVTETDPFKMGKPLYRFGIGTTGGDGPFLKEGMRSLDGRTLIYVNGAYKNTDTEIGRLIHDLRCPSADEMYSPLMAQRTRYLKENPEGVKKMSELYEEIYEEIHEESFAEGKAEGFADGKAKGKAEGLVEGKAEGLAEAQRKTVERMTLANRFSADDIALSANLPVEEVLAIQAIMG